MSLKDERSGLLKTSDRLDLLAADSLSAAQPTLTI
jgi:hypothetical protein